MIKQDNRPKSDTFEARLNSLKNLLCEPSQQNQDKPPENNPAAGEPGKAVFISVNGNNNIISAGKSQYIIWDKKKKNTPFAGLIFCMLFF